MKKVLAVVAVALVAALVFTPATSAQSKWVRGTVVSVAGDTLVVKVAGSDMTFKVDKSTTLTARGAGKAQAAAEAKGAAGVKFADFVKAGQGVEVHYKDVGGVLTAIDVHSGLGGSIFPNAAWRLTWALNTLKSPDEKILIPGWYDDILPPSQRDLELLEALPEVNAVYKKQYGVKRFLNDLTGGLELRVAEVFQPTCTRHGCEAQPPGELLHCVEAS